METMRSSFSGWNGFVYVLKGRGKFGGPEEWTESASHHVLVFGPGDYIQIKNEVSAPSAEGRSSCQEVQLHVE